MNYLERYRNGEYEQVWSDLQTLGPTIRQEPYYSQAQEVAVETMSRVRRNCEQLVVRLRTLGFIFGTFPDGSLRSYPTQPLSPPSDVILADCAELEAQAGPLPLSLVAFWQEVGSVDLVGMHPAWPDGLDPLVIEPPEGALALLYDYEGVEGGSENFPLFAGLAPDDFHKDNVSGGDPYGVRLPNTSADFLFLYERHSLLFVPYLRFAILHWGGFPGLDGKAVQFDPLEGLVEGLEPF